MLLSVITSNFLGNCGFLLLAMGFIFTFAGLFCSNSENGRVKRLLKYMLSTGIVFTSAGIISLFLSASVSVKEDIAAAAESKDYDDRIEVSSGNGDGRVYSGELVRFGMRKDFYYFVIENRDGERVEVCEPKECSVVIKR